MGNHETIWDFQRAIVQVYKDENIGSLRGLNEDYILKDKQILVWFHAVTRMRQLQTPNFSYMKLQDDLLYCSDEVMYFTANMYLYRPYLNNPIKDGFHIDSGVVYPNYETLESKRYNMFSDITLEKIYNFWDRIGDLIASYFPELIKPDRVFFASAIEVIPKGFRHLESYLWLEDFKSNAYKKLNSKRKTIVHYTTSNTEFRFNHIFNSSNKNEIEDLVNNRYEMADFCKEHICYTLEGFYQTLCLLEEVNAVMYKAV